MKWFKIISHDYMDANPEVVFNLFNEETAKGFVKHMRQSYSGGTTNYGGYATKEEILEYCKTYNINLDSDDDLKSKILNPDNYL